MIKKGISALRYRVKNSQILGFVYLQMMTLFFHFLVLVLPKKKQIMFASFSGRQYSDSPKVLFESIRNDKKFKDYQLKWAFVEPKSFPEIPNNQKVKMDSFKYFLELFSSTVWVSNASIERLIPYKPQSVTYINTWHGVPLKKLGPDEPNLDYLIKNWYKKVQFDLLTSSGQYDRQVFKHIFPSSERVAITGLPRNRALYAATTDTIQKSREFIIQKYKLDRTKPIILYAPTFREYVHSAAEVTFDNPFDTQTIKKLSEKYNVLIRGHYFITEGIDSPQCTDLSQEKNLNALLMASDALISDYSSIIFDYALLNKPIFLYCYDLDEYIRYRGMYLNPQDLGLPIVKNNEEMLNILEQDYNIKQVQKFSDKFNDQFDLQFSDIKSKILEGETE